MTATQPNSVCPTCGSAGAEVFFTQRRVPVFCCVFPAGRDEALRAARADVELAFCPVCGMIWNRAFDERLVEYDAGYENSLHFSPAALRYSEQVADRLIAGHRLAGKTVLEIGCGDGHFLSLLCKKAGCRGFGYDPGLRGKPAPVAGPDVAFVPDLFTEGSSILGAGLVCCRHVLEHVADPAGLLRAVRAAIRDRDTPVYFEVPNGLWVLREFAAWDVIYEHNSYFTPPSLRTLFGRAGFEVTSIAEEYGDQYLAVEARPVPAGRPVPADPGREKVGRLVRQFREAYEARVRLWQERLRRLRERRSRVVVWGAGTRGVTFLNTLDPDGSAVEAIVDLNPAKVGRFVAGTGQRVIAPAELSARPPDVVVVVNPIYEAEIRKMLRGLDLEPDVLVA